MKKHATTMTLLALTVTGRFGHELGAELARPFFVLVRTLRIFRTLERFEALVVMLWIFPDFLTAALFLRAGSDCLQRLLGLGRAGSAAQRIGLRDGRLLIWAAALFAAGLALLLSPDARTLSRWSEAIIPAANLAFCFVLLPAVYLLARAGEDGDRAQLGRALLRTGGGDGQEIMDRHRRQRNEKQA